MDSTALLATMPSPTADPNATPEMMIPNEISVAPIMKACGFTRFPFSMLLGNREGEIDDSQQSKHERLHGTDEEVEELNKERHDGYRERKIDRPKHDLGGDDRSDDNKQQF